MRRSIEGDSTCQFIKGTGTVLSVFSSHHTTVLSKQAITPFSNISWTTTVRL